MKIKVVFLSAAFAVLIFGGVNTNANVERRAPTSLNIREPLEIIGTAYTNFADNFDIMKLLILLLKVWSNCLQPILFPPPTVSTLSSISLAEDFNLRLNDSELKLIREKTYQLMILPKLVFEQPIMFCNMPGFETIHEFVWKTETQLEDLVHFFGKFGYPEIYKVIESAYTTANCPADLIGDLPKAPVLPPTRKGLEGQSSLTNIREQLLQSRRNPRQEEPTCKIIDIISQIPETGLLQLLKLIETITYQFNTNHNLHFLIGKLQEPVKGKSVRKFRSLPAVKGILNQLHQELIKNEGWSQVFTIIKELVGVDFFVLNPYNFIISLFEYLVWETPFPALS